MKDAYPQISKDEMYNQIECLIQQQYQIFVPALVLEYSNEMKNEFEWEYDDLYQVCSYFGEIDTLEINGRNAFVLFKNFFDAYSCKEYLLNTNNFKIIENNNNIKIRWFTSDDENKINTNLLEKIKSLCPSQIINHLNNNCQNNNNNNYFNPNTNNFNYGNKENFCSNIKVPNSYYSAWTLTPNARQEFNNMMYQQNMYDSSFNMMNPYSNFNMMGNMNMNMNVNVNNYMGNPNEYYQSGGGNNSGYNNKQKNCNTSYSYNNDNYYDNVEIDDKKSQDRYYHGKYTCRFEIQIENDKDFQVARRLIGAKGCNMKRIIEKCNTSKEGRKNEDSVKLRLRGRGSGFKEGPNNQESDEPLHLCISSKFYDKYKNACTLVQELIINIYEEYKRFCERNHKTPISNLSIKKYEGISSNKDSISGTGSFENLSKKCEDKI
jgi:hypothetical protein